MWPYLAPLLVACTPALFLPAGVVGLHVLLFFSPSRAWKTRIEILGKETPTLHEKTKHKTCRTAGHTPPFAYYTACSVAYVQIAHVFKVVGVTVVWCGKVTGERVGTLIDHHTHFVLWYRLLQTRSVPLGSLVGQPLD